MMSFQQEDLQQSSLQRRCELALQSWKLGDDMLQKPQSGGPLALSSNSSSIDLKDFLARKGSYNHVQVKMSTSDIHLQVKKTFKTSTNWQLRETEMA